ncbi:hypothetical protein FHS18_005430 [Paenibacillus phyllosphaerae]|uniref:Uncharacterized protein n=1 Tax=Paenibacillus phyllosphaerae TaxID=274593 RepID=A0A7W5B2V6_9BACL|nr:hypothetical protein [Paenibacillus phyllosphaerae]MBB3113318.1 hypothetical protein [Paenibacillus phyllosphaerae]
MDFSDLMRTFIGRNVESYQEGQFLTGRLANVTEGSLIIEAIQSVYSPVSGLVTVLTPNINYVRILP